MISITDPLVANRFLRAINQHHIQTSVLQQDKKENNLLIASVQYKGLTHRIIGCFDIPMGNRYLLLEKGHSYFSCTSALEKLVYTPQTYTNTMFLKADKDINWLCPV